MWQGAFARPDPRAKTLVAETGDGEIVGFARGGPIRSETAELLGTEAEIFAIYLLDRVKRQGIGRRLMTGVFDHLGGQGFRSAGLWVLKDNLSARRFYETLGGTPGPEQILRPARPERRRNRLPVRAGAAGVSSPGVIPGEGRGFMALRWIPFPSDGCAISGRE